MNSLKLKWDQLTGAMKLVVVVVAAIVAVIFVVKILPILAAAMGIGLLLALLFIPYWVPTIVAFVRRHPSKAAILAVNFFFGWTFVGWVLSLAWALSDNTGRSQTVVVSTTVNPSFMVGSIGTQDAPPPPQYRVGDVQNGHRFDGVSWVPLQQELPPAAPMPPVAGIDTGP
jgi:hypothetical protein